MKVLISGGAGFVGSSLARQFIESGTATEVVVLDNLRRRGSELNLRAFKELGIRFVHGDVRHFSDLISCGSNFDLLVEASAEPSVHAGMNDDPEYVFQTNLAGTFNCLQFARHNVAQFLFLSTSRIYSIPALREIALEEAETRFRIKADQTLPGLSGAGISEKFPTDSFRSFYGATKLSSEHLVQEFAAAYGLVTKIYRCGVIAGPGQFGKTDQGVFTYWVARHYFGQPLEYTGFGGLGKQVRDLLHPADLFDLIRKDCILKPRKTTGPYNVGGGMAGSVSLAELTQFCQTVVGRIVPIGSRAETAPVDVPLFICDHSRVSAETGWRPMRTVESIVNDIFDWIRKNEAELRPLMS